MRNHFSMVLECVQHKLDKNIDIKEYNKFHQCAINMLKFREIHGLQLGYGSNNSHGLGIGKGKAEILEKALTDLVKRSISDPNLFYLLPILSDARIGADSISDMAISILQENVYRYTNRMLQELKIDNSKKKKFLCKNKFYELVPHPKYPKYPLLLIPSDILSNLPVMNAYDRYIYYDSNREVQEFLEQQILTALPINKNGKPSRSKSDIKHTLQDFTKKANQEDMNNLLIAIMETKPNQYDPTQSYLFIKFIQEIVLSQKINCERELKGIVSSILYQFKYFVEHNTNRILKMYGKTPTEKQLQTLLHANIDQICQHNNLDISIEPESNNGRIDIKLSQGLKKIIIEIKLSKHKKLVTHYDNQLLAYQTAENNAYGFFVVFDIDTGNIKEIDELQKTPKYENREHIIIDTKLKIPPSKII